MLICAVETAEKTIELGWSEWLSIIATAVAMVSALVTFLQNRKLHNENKKLQVLPDLDIQLLLDGRILGRIVKRKDAIDEFNVFESKYTPLYTNHDIHINNCYDNLFTMVVKNIGNGCAKNIKLESITIKTEKEEISSGFNAILFSCDKSEEKAMHICCDLETDDVKNVIMKISYDSILGEHFTVTKNFRVFSGLEAELEEYV